MPRVTDSTADAPKGPAVAPIAAQPILAVNIEEGEILVGETLMVLRGGEIPGGSSAPPSDKEVEALEGLNLDETGKLRFFVFLNTLF